MPFAKPLGRTREYIGILRDIWARRGPLVSDGPYYPLPLPDGTELGKPLKASIHPLRVRARGTTGAGPTSPLPSTWRCDRPASRCCSRRPSGHIPGGAQEGFATSARRKPGVRVAATVPFIVSSDIARG
jgi:hypothetical protein